ncbi:endopeptidase La [Candidatus Woesebacteria bacterium RIFCSPHIGHO2_01_FULL_44_21]|uniref:Lon protease n=1 Tax=Candidatus Woesebacteria bacterium RIFCSPHIGHO2_01_FULL_44_21 TaxID=1802503 RepID=A0A1F7Z1Q5_9BACT|nr:MAG: endopeptidase La [Candidatus Woesebacteria bacterium RIFCSPHIGHO2_01_FULL_44_21]OGM69453.1 MAG: endopeptidase La [Candidatus Woesebacteria bacterium RIFCSPLOWO2_01_FULL_44_24b]
MDDIIKVTRTVPIVAIRGTTIFPHTDSILSFGRPKSVASVSAAFQSDRVVAVFAQKSDKIVDPAPHDLYKIGTLATITQMMTTEGEIHAMVRGQTRVRLGEVTSEEPYMTGSVTEVLEEDYEGEEVKALAGKLSELFKKAINMGKGVEVTTIMRVLSQQTDPIELVDSAASLLELKTRDKQELLEMLSVRDRLTKVIDYLSQEINVLDLERTISVKTQRRFEDQMRRAMLREKKKTIEEELGEEGLEDGGDDDIKELREKIKKAGMPKAVLVKARKELKRLRNMSPHNPEGGYIRNYLDWLAEMPWSKTSESSVSIEKANEVLEEDHYGLEKPKERILEYLSVLTLKNGQEKSKDNGSHPTILCFVGPPGVGKTSIGKSIAKALDREFVRVSLGGIRDEAELRGHRRTYVGAMPGRIIQSIRDAGTKNPVFMLDEVDKLGADYRGDPASALLEILDPEQNKEFSDHYLEVPFDLSEVMFICTANVLDTIPLPLRDRMEIIRFAGYIDDEKFHISKKYLWPKQIRLNGLTGKGIKVTDSAVKEIIKHYTREAGIRELERSLATLDRKIARLVAEKKKYPTLLGKDEVRKFLGPAKFRSQIAEKNDEAGMATGLAVTSAGGEILFIEVALMPGTGKLTLTGQLGSVMKESAKAAFTWTKAHWRDLGLRGNFSSKMDVHIHVPEGATPKDGPSAGVAISTALVSALTGVATRRDVGMTGEVTLRGRVLEIGGVKEKVVAGHVAGLKTIILPRDNKKDMEDIPANVRAGIKFVFAEALEDVLKVALTRWPLMERTDEQLPHAPAFIASA